MSKNKKTAADEVLLRFEKDAEYDGKVVYKKGEHLVPLVSESGIAGWAERWIRRGAVDVASETAKAEVIARDAKKAAEEAQEKADRAKAEASGAAQRAQTSADNLSNKAKLAQEKADEEKAKLDGSLKKLEQNTSVKTEDKKDQDGQKGEATAETKSAQ